MSSSRSNSMTSSCGNGTLSDLDSVTPTRLAVRGTGLLEVRSSTDQSEGGRPRRLIVMPASRSSRVSVDGAMSKVAAISASVWPLA